MRWIIVVDVIKGDKMTIAIKQIPTEVYVLNEDLEMVAAHEDAFAVYEIGGDGITEPRGGWYVECPAWDCPDMSQAEVDSLIEGLMPEEPDYE